MMDTAGDIPFNLCAEDRASLKQGGASSSS
jgi:hypothetical protein